MVDPAMLLLRWRFSAAASAAASSGPFLTPAWLQGRGPRVVVPLPPLYLSAFFEQFCCVLSSGAVVNVAKCEHFDYLPF